VGHRSRPSVVVLTPMMLNSWVYTPSERHCVFFTVQVVFQDEVCYVSRVSNSEPLRTVGVMLNIQDLPERRVAYQCRCS
jgi:hypothetical protein